MPDYGRQATDAEYRRLQAKVKKVYQEAYEDIYKKNLDFVKRHERKEAQYRQMVDEGKITQADFDAWMRGQVFQGKQWEAKRKQMEATLFHADEMAMDMINGSRVRVFADNANYIGYEIEQHGKIQTSFGLYDINSVKRLLMEEPDLLPPRSVGKDESYKWYNRQIQGAVTQGIIQGESLTDIAKRIGQATGERCMNAMLRNARTMHTGAECAGRIEGMHQAQKLGINVKKRWLATLDSHTRDSHRDLDGQVQDVDDPFESPLGKIMFPGDPAASPANVWNCFVGQTKVASDSEIIRSYKHDYNGELFIIKTARGVEFTCTPNHPILTPHGWIGANRLHEGDNILIAGIGDHDALGVNPDVDHMFSRLDALHEFFDKTFSERAAGLSVDFHGDRATANVEVVSKERFLMNDRDSGSGEMGDEFQLKHTATLVLTKRHLVPGFRRIHISALRFMRRAGKPLSFFGRGLSHAIKHGFRAVPWSDTAIFEPKCDSMPSNVQFLGQSLDGFPGQMLVDDIVNINITTVSHIPVFNLQTRNGYYFVNDIIAQNREKCNGYFAIAHNCRCTLVSVYPEYPDEMMKRRDNETGEIIDNMTYREWEAMKRGEKVLEPGSTQAEQAEQTQKTVDYFDMETTREISVAMGEAIGRPVDLQGMDKTLAARTARLYTDLVNEYGIRASSIGMNNKRAAFGQVNHKYTGEKKLTFSKSLFESPDKLREVLMGEQRKRQTIPIRGGVILDYVQTHEFAHLFGSSLEDGYYNANQPFWKEIGAVMRKYIDDRSRPLGKYAAQNIDEFMAEAFADGYLNRQPTEYGQLVKAIVDKYFKKRR